MGGTSVFEPARSRKREGQKDDRVLYQTRVSCSSRTAWT